MIDSSHFRLSLWSQKSQFDWHDSKIPLCLISNATVIVYVTVRKDVYSAYFSVLRLSFCSPLLWSATAFPVFVCLFCVYLFVKPRPGFWLLSSRGILDRATFACALRNFLQSTHIPILKGWTTGLAERLKGEKFRVYSQTVSLSVSTAIIKFVNLHHNYLFFARNSSHAILFR